MRVAIFGLGYVGAVSAACLADIGNTVLGVDTSIVKTDLIRQGKPPVVELGLDEMMARNVGAGRLRAVDNAAEAVMRSDLALVCVGTPSKPNGDLDLSHVANVCTQIGAALTVRKEQYTVVIRSTVLPGTVRNFIIPVLERESGKKVGVDFGVANNPEFLREGTAIADFFNPPKTVIGATDDVTAQTVATLYQQINAPLILASIEVGEMVKYTDNVWHAVKVAFANEIGTLCKSVGVDSQKVMDIFCQDTKLNISPYYLRPGFAFGGSCLPKDLRALTYRGRSLDLTLPLLNAVIPSNELQIERGIEQIIAVGRRKVSVLGISFKDGTDDMRESPVLEVVERLIGKGYDLRIFDPSVNLANVVGANREYMLKAIPHISRLLVPNLCEALEHGETIVIGNRNPAFLRIAEAVRENQFVVDLVRIANMDILDGRYEGINW